MNSIRSFFCRPSTVELVATGSSYPAPPAFNLQASTPRSMSSARTRAARRWLRSLPYESNPAPGMWATCPTISTQARGAPRSTAAIRLISASPSLETPSSLFLGNLMSQFAPSIDASSGDRESSGSQRSPGAAGTESEVESGPRGSAGLVGGDTSSGDRSVSHWVGASSGGSGGRELHAIANHTGRSRPSTSILHLGIRHMMTHSRRRREPRPAESVFRRLILPARTAHIAQSRIAPAFRTALTPTRVTHAH